MFRVIDFFQWLFRFWLLDLVEVKRFLISSLSSRYAVTTFQAQILSGGEFGDASVTHLFWFGFGLGLGTLQVSTSPHQVQISVQWTTAQVKELLYDQKIFVARSCCMRVHVLCHILQKSCKKFPPNNFLQDSFKTLAQVTSCNVTSCKKFILFARYGKFLQGIIFRSYRDSSATDLKFKKKQRINQNKPRVELPWIPIDENRLAWIPSMRFNFPFVCS